jgi:hypothetical protein
MRLPALVCLFALAACGNPASRLEVGGRQLVIDAPEVTLDLKGRRVVDMGIIQPNPVWESWSPEIEERMTMGGEQMASRACGGPVELVSLSRFMLAARSASLRFRCL